MKSTMLKLRESDFQEVYKVDECRICNKKINHMKQEPFLLIPEPFLDIEKTRIHIMCEEHAKKYIALFESAVKGREAAE
jgi:hypothetical protein